jgi:hypothetical protein
MMGKSLGGRALFRFLVCCAIAYWLWSMSLELEALRAAVEHELDVELIVRTPLSVAREWLRAQIWLQP